MKQFDSDRDLLTALKKGESRAFDQIYQLHFRPLCFYAERLTANTQAAEDIVAETFIKLLKSNSDFENLGKLKAWLYTVTGNACLNLLQQQKRQQSSQLEVKYLASLPDDNEAEVVRAEVLAAIHTAIKQLPKKCRRIIELSFIEGKKIEEIAAEMNIAYHTVQNQKTTGIKLLRLALLENQGLTPAVLAAGLLFLSEKGIEIWDKMPAQLL